MPHQTAPLTVGQYTQVRGNHRVRWLLIQNPNAVVFKARVNQAVFADSFSQVTYDSVTIGSFSAALEGFTVLIAHTDDIRAAFFRGRVRKAPTSNTLYINRTSLAITDNDYIFVIKEVGLDDKKPWVVADVIYFDDDLAFRQLRPLIRGMQTVYYARLSGGVADIAIAPNPLATTSGASISSHLWSGDTGSFQAGSSTTENVTLRYTTAGVYWARYQATDSGGRVNWFTTMICINDDDDSIIAAELEAPSTANDVENGYTSSLELKAGSALEDTLDQTRVVIVKEEVFGTATTTPILSNIAFIGALKKEANATSIHEKYGKVSSVTLEVEGFGQQLGRLILPSAALRRTASPAVFGEIAALTLWRAIVFVWTELCMAGNILALNFDDTSDDYSIPLIGTEEASVGDTLENAAFTINAYIQHASAGEVMISRHTQYKNSTDKAAQQINAAFTSRDWVKILSLSREHVLNTGRVIGFAGTYNATSNDTTAIRAIAPARVWSSGQGRSQINRQVLQANLSLADAQIEAAQRIGSDYAAKNQQTILELELPGAYGYLQARVDQLYTFVITTADNKRELAFDTSHKWWLKRVEVSHDLTRQIDRVKAVFVLDTENVSALVVAELAPEDVAATIPNLPPFQLTPFPMPPSLFSPDGTGVIAPEDEQPYTSEDLQRVTRPQIKPTDEPASNKPKPSPAQLEGSVVMVFNGGGVWITENFTRADNPVWKNISPTGSGITQAIFDPHSAGGWVISNDGTDTTVWRADNLLNPSWTSVVVEDVFTQIRATSAGGEVYIYAAEGDGTESGEYDTDSDEAVLIGGSSWIAGSPMRHARAPSNGALAEFDIVFDDPVELVEFTYQSQSLGSGPTLNTGSCELWLEGVLILTLFSFSKSDGGYVWGVDPAVNAIESTTGAGTEFDTIKFKHTHAGKQADVRGSVTIIGPGGDSKVFTCRSTNNGASFAEKVEAGETPGVSSAGFDTVKVGSTVLAGTDEKVTQASSGGAYSDATGGDTTGSYARAIWAYATSGVNFLMASAAAVSSETLWRVVGGSKSAITPNDGSNDGIVVGPFGLCMPVGSSTVIFMLGNFGGTIKLARSTNLGTSWSITTGVAAGALAVRAKNANQVYIANGNSILYSEDGGATLLTKGAPGTSLLGIEVK